MPLIEVKNVEYSYLDGTLALDDISLSIEKGEYVVIVGRNGSGKTTLVKHLNGLLKPTKGNVIIDGMDTKEHTIAEISRKASYLFQNPNHQIFSNTVYSEISFALKRNQVPENKIREKVDEVIDILGLGSIRNQHPMFINLAQKQLVAIASYLVLDPEVFILDEPTSSLDYNECKGINEITNLLSKKGHTMVVITHDMNFVVEHPERVIVMDDGKQIFDGESGELFCKNDILDRACLTPPQIKRMNSRLNGLNIPEDIFSVKSMADYILERVGR